MNTQNYDHLSSVRLRPTFTDSSLIIILMFNDTTSAVRAAFFSRVYCLIRSDRNDFILYIKQETNFRV